MGVQITFGSLRDNKFLPIRECEIRGPKVTDDEWIEGEKRKCCWSQVKPHDGKIEEVVLPEVLSKLEKLKEDRLIWGNHLHNIHIKEDWFTNIRVRQQYKACIAQILHELEARGYTVVGVIGCVGKKTVFKATNPKYKYPVVIKFSRDSAHKKEIAN